MMQDPAAARTSPGKNAADSLPSVEAGPDQWRYCTVCRRHHEQGRKHIFTKKHQNKLSCILSKFAQKVRSARQQLQKPGVMDGELEPDSTLWCYCCQQEVARHVTDRFTTVVWGGLLEHMASPSHHKKTRRFWWLNGADKKQLQNFLLFEAEYSRYKELSAAALDELETRREIKRNEEARQLEAKEAARVLVAKELPPASLAPTVRYVTVRNRFGVLQNPTGRHEGRRVWGGGIVKYKSGSDQLLPWPIDKFHQLRGGSRAGGGSGERKEGPPLTRGRVTVAASGSHLTTIELPRFHKGEGNVHSGATPPWLLTDSEEEDKQGDDPGSHGLRRSGVSKGKSRGISVMIGPSEEEFLKHREQMRRKGRKGVVGADFHLKLATSSSSLSTTGTEWFPSFGRVWNAGPRSQSLVEFKRESSGTGSTGRSTGGSHTLSPAYISSTTSSNFATPPPPPHAERPGPSGLSQRERTELERGRRKEKQSASFNSSTTGYVQPPSPNVGEIRPYVRRRKTKATTNQDVCS